MYYNTMQIFIKTERICLLRLGKILRQFDPNKSMILKVFAFTDDKDNFDLFLTVFMNVIIQ